MTDNTIIHAENLHKIYGQGRNTLAVLKGISLKIVQGEILSIMGPSGAGKSTLLNILGCLDGFQEGALSLLGKDVSTLSVEQLSGFRNSHIGFIFQQHNLLGEFNAEENIMIPLLVRRESFKVAREKAHELLERFGLKERAHHKPSEMSGGECQRIAVARAMVGMPDIIFADEPTGSLDSVNSSNLIEMLLTLGKENNTTIVIVTHDHELAKKTERCISLRDGQII